MKEIKRVNDALFPACAGVIPKMGTCSTCSATFPRMCGGDPGSTRVQLEVTAFSPHVRG